MRTPETAIGRRLSICQFMKQRNYVTADTIAKELDMSRRTATRHLAVLLDQGYIEIAFCRSTWTSRHPVNHYSLIGKYIEAR